LIICRAISCVTCIVLFDWLLSVRSHQSSHRRAAFWLDYNDYVD
jgi:hypothetical protein